MKLYSLAWWLATPLVIAYLLWRARRQPEYRAHWGERWGFHGAAAARRGDGPLIWVHAVSVGETRAAQPLVAALLERHPDARLLLTHMTPTGRATGAELFARHGGRVLQAYLPYDLGFATRRFLRAWRPALGIVMETELWPNLCAQARRAGVPLALVNARLSERSLRKGLRWRALMEPALRSLACVVAQTPADAQRIGRLGRTDVTVAGNMKFDVSPAPALVERGRGWKSLLRGRPVVLAASTRDGEEALLLDAWQVQVQAQAQAQAQAQVRQPLLVIVPRHPQRFDEVADLLAARGLRLARRSALEASGGFDPAAIDVLLGDSMGEMFAWYAMADVAVLGGSLLPFGGQNLIEACALGVPVVMGPHTFNFEDAAEQAIQAGGALRAADAGDAVAQALALLRAPDALARRSAQALEFAKAHRGATGRTLALLEPWLAPLAADGRLKEICNAEEKQ
nr:lipid IV(A) 3-deoxy-D-manno-octulosonic acid transferase [Quisquiliibacterium transsilvanicum]